MDIVAIVGAAWPIMLGFVTLVIILAKMHADIETIKEKLKVLFELINRTRIN